MNFSQTLCGVLRDNGLDELAVPVRAGLGERGGTARLYTGSMISGANLFAVDPEIDGARQHIDEIDIVSIDEMFRDRDERVGLIKLDVEGSESAAVSGAMEIICRDRPVLAVSVYHTPRDFFDIKPMLEKENLGYRFMVRKLVFHDLVTEVTLLAYTEEE